MGNVDTSTGHGAGTPGGGALRVRLLGPLALEAAGAARPLPASRKARALLGYLLLAQRPVPRMRLCDLLWDGAGDPRGELRWCLAKLRPLLRTGSGDALVSVGDAVAIDARGLDVDALALEHAVGPALVDGTAPTLQALLALIGGDVLEGLTLDRAPAFEQWLAGERARHAHWHRQLLDRLALLLRADPAAAVEVARRRAVLAPLDAAVRIDLVDALRSAGEREAAAEAQAAALRLFEREGLDAAPLRFAFARARRRAEPDEAMPWLTRPAGEAPPIAAGRASIVVMPFASLAADDADIANGLTHDVIFGLAKLRGLTVIARGTAFALQSRAASPQQAGALLGVGYHASGLVARGADGLRISIELAATDSGRVVWAEQYAVPRLRATGLLDEITRRIVTALEDEVHLAERNRALLLPPESLDAWSTYHRGLWHMFRFTASDNNAAQALFLRAVALDPAYSRAHAALSFTHFQNAFLLKAGERDAEIGRAYETAGRALMADAHDPAAHWAMGRALWLRGEDEACFRALDESVALSPNFSLGHYSRAFVHSQRGDPSLAMAAADTSHRLSPYDPMLFAIHSSRVLGLLRLDEPEAAAAYARQAIEQPNIHVHARAIGAIALAAAGHVDDGRAVLDGIRRERSGYALGDFFLAFRVADDLGAICRKAGEKLGLR